MRLPNNPLLFSLLSVTAAAAAAASSSAEQSTSASSQPIAYRTFPQRRSEEAAVVEWGHSAVISALDAAVASFGPQTSRGAFFEVETAPVLASPIDGSVSPGVTTLLNADEIDGNLAVMTNSSPDKLSPVQLATLAQNSGAAALMIVNTEDGAKDDQLYDYIYSMGVLEGEEEAAEAIDIPVIMTSLSSGNLLTSVGNEEDKEKLSMPDRIRLYGAGDRPFFEDVSSSEPVIYLIHNLLTDEECDVLLAQAKGKTETVETGQVNLLEGYDAVKQKVQGLERVYLWKGSILKGTAGKAIDERIEQVTGFPRDHTSDFQINKFSRNGGSQGMHYDSLDGVGPDQMPMATITVFLTDSDDEQGGEIIFPSTGTGTAVKIQPKKGMAVVHHTVIQQEDGQTDVDLASIHADLKFTSTTQDKWTAKKFVYIAPISPSRRFILPLLVAPFGGKAPKVLHTVHDTIVEKFGLLNGAKLFDRFLMFIPLLAVFMLVSLIASIIQNDSGKTNAGTKKKKSNVVTAKAVSVKKKEKSSGASKKKKSE